MKEFFHGWRRKAGCVTLLVALASMGGWIRSMSRQDSIAFCPTKSMYGLYSGYGYFGVLRFDFPSRAEVMRVAGLSGSPFEKLGLAWSSSAITEKITTLDLRKGAQAKSHWKIGEFYWGTSSSVQHFDETYVFFPCWSLTIPLTLLSASLILWKPRKRA